MKEHLRKVLSSVSLFLSVRKNRRLVYLAALCMFALGDFLFTGLVRRTFMFYTIRDTSVVVEERFLRRSGNRETDIRRYVEEALLGPKSQEMLALPFYRSTQALIVMYRNGIVFADLSASASIPPPDGGSLFSSFLTLNKGIRRNFPFVKDVRFFIGGNQVFFEEFRRIFAQSAENSRT
jgi:hypothetical protein